LVVHNGESGKIEWNYLVAQNERRRDVSERAHLGGLVMFGKGLALLPINEQRSQRHGQIWRSNSRISLHVVDLKSGKKLRTFDIEPPDIAPKATDNFFSHVTILSGTATTGHAAFLVRGQAGGQGNHRLYVIDAATGKAVMNEPAPPKLFEGHNAHFLGSRAEIIITADGHMLVPTGDGIQGYASTPPDDKPPAADNTPAP